MKCKPDSARGGTLSKTRLASCSGGVLAGSTGEPLRLNTGRILGRIHRQGILSGIRRDPLASYSGIQAGATGALLWWDTRRDPLASYSGILSGILGGTHWCTALAILGGIHWRATLPGYLAGSTGELLWDTGGSHWRAALVGYSARSTGELLWDTQAESTGALLWRYSAGSTGELLCRDTWRDPLASHSRILSGMLGGIHRRAALVGYSAGSALAGDWRDPDARRDPRSRFGRILGGIHWRAALQKY